MKLRGIAAMVCALFLQLTPLVRVVPAACAAPLAALVRWLGAVASVGGAFHALSGATEITSAAAVRATNGVAFIYRITATGTPESFDATPLPTGLAVDPVTGRITGKPTQTGIFKVRLTAWDGPGMTMATISSDLTLTVIDPPRPPRILSQPTDQRGPEGGEVTIAVEAEALPGLKYRWRKADLELAGATNSTFTLKPLKPTDAGNYSVRITAANGLFTNSVSVRVDVLPAVVPPVIVAQTGDRHLHAGEPAQLTVTATVAAGQSASYQWKRDDQVLPNATGSVLDLGDVGPASAGRYVVTVSAGGLHTDSQPIMVTVADPLRVFGLKFQAPGAVVRFGAVSGRTYDLQALAVLAPPAGWQTLATLFAVGSDGVLEDSRPAAETQFYRIVVHP